MYGNFGREITKYTVIYSIQCIYTVLANPTLTVRALLHMPNLSTNSLARTWSSVGGWCVPLEDKAMGHMELAGADPWICM
jgi:hypothetical protein